MKNIKRRWKWVSKNRLLVITISIFLLEIILRFYNIGGLNPFGYDQVDNAWAAKNLIVNGKIPLVGMVAKGNSGVYIGPVYYWLISIFYFIFNLNPIASGVFAGVTSIFTFWSLFYVVKKVFSWEAAIIAVFINTVAFDGIFFDRVQWPVDFIPGISILIFYFLYKVITGNSKYIIYLALSIGFAFNIHFTAVFFPIMVFASLPFFPRTRETVKHILISIPIFIVWLIPNIIVQIQQGGSQTAHMSGYLNSYYHGFHLRRVVQLLGDAFIQFEKFAGSGVFKPLKYLLLPVFILYYLRKKNTDKMKFCYLVILWFLVPLLVFATYSGEITDYYFSINRFIVLMLMSYLIYEFFKIKQIAPKAIVVVTLFLYAVINIGSFISHHDIVLNDREKEVKKTIRMGGLIPYKEGAPESYLYFYYMTQIDPTRWRK